MQVRQLNVDTQGIRGLTYIADYISKSDERDLLAKIDQQAWSNELRRRVQHYGYRYDYKKRHVGPSGYVGALPSWLLLIANQLCKDGFVDSVPDQCAINEYLPGQGIATHVDCVPCFGETIFSLSLGSTCVMEFSHNLYPVKKPLLLEPRSLLIMRGESRYQWKHGIPPRKADRVHSVDYPRQRRVSVTFRNTLLDSAAFDTSEQAAFGR